MTSCTFQVGFRRKAANSWREVNLGSTFPCKHLALDAILLWNATLVIEVVDQMENGDGKLDGRSRAVSDQMAGTPTATSRALKRKDGRDYARGEEEAIVLQ